MGPPHQSVLFLAAAPDRGSLWCGWGVFVYKEGGEEVEGVTLKEGGGEGRESLKREGCGQKENWGLVVVAVHMWDDNPEWRVGLTPSPGGVGGALRQLLLKSSF